MLDGLVAIFTNPITLPLMVAGVCLGIMMGAIPGFGATLGIALLIPFTFGLDAQVALPMLAGVYAGALYGGSIITILVGIPGTSANAATLLDGYPMTKRGESKKALMLSVYSSAFAGVFASICLLLLAPLLSRFTLLFGPAEYAVLAFFGLSIIATVSGGSIIKGLIAGLLGIVLSLVGMDPITGEERFTFGEMYLLDGLPLIPFILAIFAFPRSMETVRDAVTRGNKDKREIKNLGIGPPLRAVEFFRMWKLWLRSSIIGTIIGMIPAAGGNIACWVGYSEAKRTSKHPEKFGTGIAEGIVAPEAANNATEGGSLIPMLTLSIPGSAPAAVLIGALLVHGLVPGPALFTKYATITYTFIWGVLLTNILMLIIGLYGGVYFAKIAKVPPQVLAPIMLFLTVLGAFATRQLYFDMSITVLLGTAFYLLTIAKFPMPPILLGFILGPIAEKGMRRALLISDGDWTVFFTRPICVILIVLTLFSLYAGLRILRLERSDTESRTGK